MYSNSPGYQSFLLLSDAEHLEPLAAEHLGERLHSVTSPAVSGGEHKSVRSRILLSIDPATPGVVSEFRERGQAIRFGADPREVLEPGPTRTEFETLIERLCYRHKLAVIYYEEEAFVSLLRPAAERLGLELTTWQGAVM